MLETSNAFYSNSLPHREHSESGRKPVVSSEKKTMDVMNDLIRKSSKSVHLVLNHLQGPCLLVSLVY